MKFIFKIIAFYFNLLSWISPKLSAKQSFNLFAYPFGAKLNPKQQSFLSTAKLFKVIVDGKNVQCYQWGNGKEKILFVHGWQSHSYRWKSYIGSLDKSKYSIYAFDAPGHGNSEGRICTIPLYEKAIQALIEKKGAIDHLVGHSIGSFACASFLFHHNYHVQTYVSLASPFHALEFLDDYVHKIKLSNRSIEYLLRHFKNYTTHPLAHYSQKTFCTALNAKRILIIHDKLDEATSYHNAQKTYDLLKENKQNVDLIITEGFRHSLRDAEIVTRVMNCLAQQPAFES